MSMTPHYTIQMQRHVEVNTDPQRRCYNGCHAKSEIVKTPWVDLNLHVTADTVEDKLKFWRELNDYAVSQRGKSARIDYRAIPETTAQEQT